jgi:hypothetical protein
MAFSKGLKLILFVAVSIATAPALAGTLYSSIPDLDVAPDGNVWYSGGIGCSQVQCRFVVDKFSLRQASQISAVQFSVESNYGPQRDRTLSVKLGSVYLLTIMEHPELACSMKAQARE